MGGGHSRAHGLAERGREVSLAPRFGCADPERVYRYITGNLTGIVLGWLPVAYRYFSVKLALGVQGEDWEKSRFLAQQKNIIQSSVFIPFLLPRDI